MIPYMVGKLAPNLSHLTRGLVSPVGAIFVPFPPKSGTNMLHPRPPPPIVELGSRRNITLVQQCVYNWSALKFPVVQTFLFTTRYTIAHSILLYCLMTLIIVY